MKHSLTISAMLIAAALLSGCSAKSESVPASTPESSAEPGSAPAAATAEAPADAALTTEAPVQTEEPLPVDIIGIIGDKVTASDITEIKDLDNAPLTLEQLTSDNWNYLRCDFAYAAPSTGICYTSADNADIFDSSEVAFRDVPEFAANEYHRIKAGDEICGFTVTKASTDFLRLGTFAPDENGEGTYFRCSSAEFEGSAELTGYVWIAPEDDYCIYTGDIYFVPAPGSDILPVMNYDYMDGGVKNHLFMMSHDDFYWLNEYPNILLGNTSDIKVDVSTVPIDNQYHKAKITIDGMTISSDIDWLSSVRCSLTGLELL